MNPLHTTTNIGTIGEIFVQLKFLEHNIQAAPPIKDSGNDLIAVKGDKFFSIQVKTTTKRIFSKNNLEKSFHLLVFVHLIKQENNIYFSFDKSQIFVIPKDEINTIRSFAQLEQEYLFPNVLNRILD